MTTLQILSDQGRFSPKHVVIDRITMILLLLFCEVIMEPLSDFATMKTAQGVVLRVFLKGHPRCVRVYVSRLLMRQLSEQKYFVFPCSEIIMGNPFEISSPHCTQYFRMFALVSVIFCPGFSIFPVSGFNRTLSAFSFRVFWPTSRSSKKMVLFWFSIPVLILKYHRTNSRPRMKMKVIKRNIPMN